MFFSQRMLGRSALLTPMLALGLAASPVHSAPSEMSWDPSFVVSRDTRADTNGTFEETITECATCPTGYTPRCGD